MRNKRGDKDKDACDDRELRQEDEARVEAVEVVASAAREQREDEGNQSQERGGGNEESGGLEVLGRNRVR